MESGSFALSDGAKIEAGKFVANNLFTPVALKHQYSTTPVILTQSQTYNGNSAITTRQRNPSTTKFEARVQEEEGNDGTHNPETVGYIAVQPTLGEIEAQFTGDKVTQDSYQIDFKKS